MISNTQTHASRERERGRAKERAGDDGGNANRWISQWKSGKADNKAFVSKGMERRASSVG